LACAIAGYNTTHMPNGEIMWSLISVPELRAENAYLCSQCMNMFSPCECK